MYRSLFNWIFPSHCAWCGKETASSEALCQCCFAKILAECSSSLHLLHTSELADFSPYSSGKYSGRLRQAILLWKKQNCRLMCGHFAELLAYTIPAEAWGWPIVYIPGHPKNIRFRGWDPMQVTASLLADITGGECLHALVRFKKSRIQKNLDVDQRKKNAEYMFGISDVDIPDRLILIDDITTTGASIKHAAQKLSEQGVGKMYCFTIAQD